MFISTLMWILHLDLSLNILNLDSNLAEKFSSKLVISLTKAKFEEKSVFLIILMLEPYSLTIPHTMISKHIA